MNRNISCILSGSLLFQMRALRSRGLAFVLKNCDKDRVILIGRDQPKPTPRSRGSSVLPRVLVAYTLGRKAYCPLYLIMGGRVFLIMESRNMCWPEVVSLIAT